MQSAPHDAALRHLAACHPAFAPLIARLGPPPPPGPRTAPYQALIRAIAHQQLHGNAARAILARFAALFPARADGDATPAPHLVAAVDDAALRACGFSATKVAAIRDICAHTIAGTVPTLAETEHLSDEAIIARLLPIRGVGRWTVEMMLMTALGRPDVLPVDDFGIRDGWRLLNGDEVQPKPRALAAIGAAWAPHRSTAAWYLWRRSDEGKRIKQST